MREKQKPIVSCIVEATISASNAILDSIAKTVTGIARRMQVSNRHFEEIADDNFRFGLRILCNDKHRLTFEGSGIYRTQTGEDVEFRIEITLAKVSPLTTDRLRWKASRPTQPNTAQALLMKMVTGNPRYSPTN